MSLHSSRYRELSVYYLDSWEESNLGQNQLKLNHIPFMRPQTERNKRYSLFAEILEDICNFGEDLHSCIVYIQTLSHTQRIGHTSIITPGLPYKHCLK